MFYFFIFFLETGMHFAMLRNRVDCPFPFLSSMGLFCTFVGTDSNWPSLIDAQIATFLVIRLNYIYKLST